MDGVVQANELTGVPTSSSARFNTTTGVFAPAGNSVDPSTKISRTREAVVGIQHELISNLAIGVDYIYRKYDRGLATYTIGYQPGAPGYPLSADLHRSVRPSRIRSPAIPGSTTSSSQARCGRPALGSITMTNPNYQVYNGARHHRHQALQQQVAARRRGDDSGQPATTSPEGSVDFSATRPAASLPGRRQHHRQVRDQVERELRPALGLPGGGQLQHVPGRRAHPDRSTARATCTAASTRRAPTRRSATRRWSSSRATASASAPRRCSTWACRRGCRSATGDR